jgi:hypothetical protein
MTIRKPQKPGCRPQRNAGSMVSESSNTPFSATMAITTQPIR